ncbi:hypothetical protein AB0C21_09410 [Spirillospora sp. NPDC049024]
MDIANGPVPGGRAPVDELTAVQEFLAEERPAAMSTVTAARRRLEREAAAKRGFGSRLRPDVVRPGRRRIVMATLGAATAISVAAGGYHAWVTRPLYHPEPLAAQSGPASDFLLAAADAKARHITDGRIWYVRKVRGLAMAISSIKKPGTVYQIVVTRNDYSVVSKDGKVDDGWNDEGQDDLDDGLDPHRVKSDDVRPAGPRDRAAWERDGRPDQQDLVFAEKIKGDELVIPRRGPEGREGGELDFGPEEARALPADPEELRAELLNYATRFDHRRLRNPDLYLFVHAPQLLIDDPVSDRVRIATYRILAALKGVRVVTATDPAGRTGRAVAMRETTREHGVIEWQLFIDPATGRLTASQGIVISPGTANAALRPGTAEFTEVVEQAEWTNKPAEQLRPKWWNDPVRRASNQD